MSLYQIFCDAIDGARDTAHNGYLHLLTRYIKDIEDSSSSNPMLAIYCDEMDELIKEKDFALKGKSVGKFIQLFGEAHFAYICEKHDVALEKIDEKKGAKEGRKNPDFHHSSSELDIHFEVKTLSVVDGGYGINKTLESALDAQIEIERQIQSGKQVATATAELQSYRNNVKKERQITDVITVLLEKARGNIKAGQYTNPNSFLVLNLSLLPPLITDNRALRPAYVDDFMFSKAETGELWMLAFGQPGMLVLGCPEFEGKPSVEGVFQKCGILVDDEFENISGMLIVLYPLSGEPYICGLYRYNDYDSWCVGKQDLVTILKNLTGKNWNDDQDTNGWQLLGH